MEKVPAMKTQRWLFVLLFSAVSFTGCQKENSSQSFKIMLTDAPFDAQEINVEIREVVVKYAKDSMGWVSLTTNAGMYNLLALQNGVQKVIATGSSPDCNLKELRLILGTANTIKIDNQTFPLTIPSGSEAGLKIKVNKKLTASLDKLVVDFDAGMSIIKTGNKDYKLKPVLKLK